MVSSLFKFRHDTNNVECFRRRKFTNVIKLMKKLQLNPHLEISLSSELINSFVPSQSTSWHIYILLLFMLGLRNRVPDFMVQ
jgi:hypothetical protein